VSKVIGIIGTRRRDSDADLKRVNDAFLKVYEEGDKICSGLCPKGGDRFAVILANLYKVQTIWHPAEWDKYGKGAGFKRNLYIARDSDVLIACVAPDRTGGTEDTIRKHLRSGKDKLILVE
jgi:hypothetical protein